MHTALLPLPLLLPTFRCSSLLVRLTGLLLLRALPSLVPLHWSLPYWFLLLPPPPPLSGHSLVVRPLLYIF